MYILISPANEDALTSSFPIPIPFISFSCLIILAKISSTILNVHGESGSPVSALGDLFCLLGCLVWPLCDGFLLYLVIFYLSCWVDRTVFEKKMNED